MSDLIAFTGHANCGKSTAAKMLVNQHGYTLVKFAGPLKQMLYAIGLTTAEIEGDLKEQPCLLLGGHTPRYAMQTLGTEWGRKLISPNLWVNVAMDGVHAVLDQGGKVVIDDCRFPNEVEAIRLAGGTVVRIVRPDISPVNTHEAEHHDLAYDYLLGNVSDHRGLADGVIGMLTQLGGR